MKRQIKVEVDYDEHSVAPRSLDNVKFFFFRELPDEQGVFNPIDGEGAYEGVFQISIHANSEGYRELGAYFLGLAEFDVGGDPAFHEHHQPVMSGDGRTRLHIICRKDDERFGVTSYTHG